MKRTHQDIVKWIAAMSENSKTRPRIQTTIMLIICFCIQRKVKIYSAWAEKIQNNCRSIDIDYNNIFNQCVAKRPRYLKIK